MILKSIIAIVGMAAVGWITWRLVSRQDEATGPDMQLDEDENDGNAGTNSPTSDAREP